MQLLTIERIRAAFGPAADLAEQLARPSARIVPVDDPGVASVQLGGLPLLPDGFAWPMWQGHPLDFVADVDLARVHGVLPGAPLPEGGRMLLFFATSLFGPTGELVGALEPRSRPGWRLLHIPPQVDRRPAVPPVEVDNPLSLGPFRTVHAELAAELTVPDSWETGVPAAWNSESVWDGFDRLEREGWVGPHHRIGGWPQPTQSAPAAPAALAAAGLSAPDGSLDWNDPRVQATTDTANDDWWLTLQLDTDDGPDGPGWMWGDAGVVFVHGRPHDLQRGAFDEAWLNWDCH